MIKNIFFMKKYFSAHCTTLRLCSEPRPVIKIINFHEKAWFSLIFIDFQGFWAEIGYPGWVAAARWGGRDGPGKSWHRPAGRRKRLKVQKHVRNVVSVVHTDCYGGWKSLNRFWSWSPKTYHSLKKWPYPMIYVYRPQNPTHVPWLRWSFWSIPATLEAKLAALHKS